eukprot:TRINITY_DN20072_c0_g1_i1.p1 TRINITY_DN20072_c0_g1~~TRINITY_DN20072_c0_g1_i1.p1  ORF type:complete len:237 (-),score=17.19 TRINITY_DN20072_c0_g1_i1:78-746(-)
MEDYQAVPIFPEELAGCARPSADRLMSSLQMVRQSPQDNTNQNRTIPAALTAKQLEYVIGIINDEIEHHLTNTAASNLRQDKLRVLSGRRRARAKRRGHKAGGSAADDQPDDETQVNDDEVEGLSEEEEQLVHHKANQQKQGPAPMGEPVPANEPTPKRGKIARKATQAEDLDSIFDDVADEAPAATLATETTATPGDDVDDEDDLFPRTKKHRKAVYDSDS